jgi:uncharacterized membrane protein
MRTAMVGYWVILVGVVLQIFGWVWDAVDDLTGEEALGGIVTPERLAFIGLAVVILGLVLGFRLGLRRRSS